MHAIAEHSALRIAQHAWDNAEPPDHEEPDVEAQIADAMKNARALDKTVPDMQGLNAETTCTPFEVVADAIGFDSRSKAVMAALLNLDHPLVAQLRKAAGDYHARNCASDIEAHRSREYY